MSEYEFAIKPVGIVRNSITDIEYHEWKNIVSAVEINPEYTEALYSIDQFSHIIVIFWFHRSPEFSPSHYKVHPRGRRDLPLVGLFSTRSPHRPNPIGVTVTRLLEKKDNILSVKGLDAVNGTPVLDIKPYIPRGDAVASARIPQWVRLL